MPRHRVGRRRDQRSWLDNVVLRARLTRPAHDAYADFVYRRQQAPGGGGVRFVFSATVPLEGFEDRRVTILFDQRYPSRPIVLADGPDDSPHRYAYGKNRSRLCLWFPSDPQERRWTPADGLLHLFAMATVHLIKEAWWRDTKVWVGEEYPHGELKEAEKAA